MGDALYIGPGRGARSASGLPADLERAATFRLSWLAVTLASLVLAFWTVVHLFELPHPLRQTFGYSFVAVIVTLSGLVFGLTRFANLRPVSILDIGLAYHVTTCFFMALLAHSVPLVGVGATGFSSVAVWILTYHLIVPSDLPRTALAASVSAAMEPLALLTLVVSGATQWPGASTMALRFAPTLIAVVFAVVGSRLMYRLSEGLDRARKLGSYELSTKIGAGGMGEVWIGKHQMLKREAAVKLIRPEQLEAGHPGSVRTLLKRFEREVKATAALKSPHTIEIYDYGIADSGTFYYVMELLDGLDMHTLLRNHGPQPAERVVHLIRQACHSLHEAHLAGLVHRDIKPANVFVCRHGTDLDFVKVLDFGLVKGEAPGEMHMSLTHQGALTGTPAFMPPEVARGERNIDGRADVYALGCCMYWLLTGQLVFELGPPMKMVSQHARQLPKPPSLRTSVFIPPELEVVVMECLQKDPAARPSSAARLSGMLAELRLEAKWTRARRDAWWSENRPPDGA